MLKDILQQNPEIELLEATTDMPTSQAAAQMYSDC